MGGLMGKGSFSDFIKQVLNSCDFDWFVTLCYIPARQLSSWRLLWEDIWQFADPDGRHWERTPRTAWECFDKWLEEIQVGPGPQGPGVRDYVWLEERRTKGDVLFHVLVANWGGHAGAWEYRWKEISGGWARTRQLDERIGGLLGYLVMRAGCILEVNCGEFRGRHTAADFRPWNAKRY